jgi:hypothetical protein
VKSGERWERDVVHGRVVGVKRVPVVELWVGGIRLTSDCESDEIARRLVIIIADELGLAS